MAIEREVVIRNKEGLHFRPIMRFVDVCTQFKSKVQVLLEDRKADARSPMELLMLVAVQGSTIKLVADGDDAENAIAALAALIESGFDEP